MSSNRKKIIKYVVITFFGLCVLTIAFFITRKANNNFDLPVDIAPQEHETSYEKNIQIEDKVLFVTVESKDKFDNVYRFYLGDNKSIPIKEVFSYIPLQNYEQATEQNFFNKDITGDGVEELFIKVEASASNLTSYEILQLKNDTLINLKTVDSESNWVDFDEITYENGYVGMTWHAADATGKTLYKIENDIFVQVKSVGFFQVPIYGETCEVRVREANEDYKVVAKEKCEVIGRDFSRYLTN